MAQVAARYSSRLTDIKEKVREWHDYFEPNFQTFHKARAFVYKSNLTTDEKSKLADLDRPPLEFNVLASYVSRLIGEWSQQEPSIYAKPAANEVNVDPRLPEIITGHFKYILDEANREGFETSILRDTLTGGYSVMKVLVDYESEYSFHKKFYVDRPFDPTLTGFDPMARLPTKSDGEFCFELFPMTEEEFCRNYPSVNAKNISYSKSISGFSWSYRAPQNKKFIIVCEFYEKKYKKTKLYKLADGSTKTKKEYDDLVMFYNENNIISQAPIIVEERNIEECIICRYTLVENQILEYIETDYPALPLIFVDGDSMLLRDSGIGDSARQVIRPYVQCAVDAQRLKNLAGQTLANDIELLQQSKLKMAVEAVPHQYQDAYKYPQRASVYMYNAFKEDGQTPLPPPEPMPRIPTPPEVTNTFVGADQVIQNILGTFNSARGVDDNNLSGKAIIEAASMSNQTAMPFIVNYLLALNQVGQIIVDMLPNYMTQERDLPMVSNDGRQVFQRINAKYSDSPKINYARGSFKICVESGTNYEVQKEKELRLLVMLSQAFPSIAQFINGAGIGVVLDTLNFSGAEQLKQLLPKWQQQMQQQAQQQGQQNPELMKAQMQMQQAQMSNQLKQQEMQVKAQIAQGEMAIDQERLQHEKAKLIFDYLMEQEKAGVQMTKSETERLVHAAELAMSHKDMEHRHAKDILEHLKSDKESNNQLMESVQ